MTPPRGPDALSWAAAALRGLHPVRWGLGLLGLAATVTVAAGLQAFWDRGPPQLGDWFGDPLAQAQELWDELAGRSFVGLVIRLGVLLTALTAVWAVVGAWIARHDLLARHRGQPYATPQPVEPGPTGLVARQLKTLATSFLIILFLCTLLLIPVLFAGLLNRLGGVGAILVAVVLPVVLVADLVLLLIAVGAVAWPLMPVTLAAENSDVFDALSRAYNYAYQRPVRFVLLTVVTLALAVVPLALVLFALAGPVENWPAVAGHPAVWAAAGLSASIYWSIQTLAYLDLRAAVDGTDPGEIARDGEPEPTPASPAVGQPNPAARKHAGSVGPLAHVVLFGFVVATWVLTAWVFARVGGETAGWLAWGMGGRLMPEAEGLYRAATVLAGVWGFLWLALPFGVMLRGAFRRAGQPAAEPEVRSEGDAGLGPRGTASGIDR